MNIPHRFLSNLHPEKKQRFRQLERLTYKLIEATNSVNYNRNCIREQLCPQSHIKQLYSLKNMKIFIDSKTLAGSNKIFHITKINIPSLSFPIHSRKIGTPTCNNLLLNRCEVSYSIGGNGIQWFRTHLSVIYRYVNIA